MSDDAQTTAQQRLTECEHRLTELRAETEALLKELGELQHSGDTAPAQAGQQASKQAQEQTQKQATAAPRATGQAIIAGASNSATSPTQLYATQTNSAALYLVGDVRGLTSVGQQNDGVLGYSGAQSGVLGMSNSGTGVRAVSQSGTAFSASSTGNTGAVVSGNGAGLVADNNGQYGGFGVIALGQVKGTGLYASGERAAIRLGQSPYAGAPTTGSHDVGELVLDSNANLYLCRKAGTPGSWARLN
ncbi:hypothetical protein V2W30_06485 [Streptomyces sp. Q6]|uniref:Uncharacterized protein n=1 Tax=Streptomyces citrinus TaxID=3118173 RepID=A0ACD5AAY4_9ACTN